MNDVSSLYTTTYSTATDPLASLSGFGVWGIIALVLAIVGGILAYFLFVKKSAEPKGKFMKWLKDFLAFKTMWIESILKVLYYIVTIYVILVSFALIPVSFLAFLAVLIGGPIIIRLIYEALIMFIMIWRNTTDIAKNTDKK